MDAFDGIEEFVLQFLDRSCECLTHKKMHSNTTCNNRKEYLIITDLRYVMDWFIIYIGSNQKR